MQAQLIKISQLKNNTGQVEGLPANPRLIKDERFDKLVKSIKDDPEMLGLREVIAYDNAGELVVIAGNMRLRACKELGIKEVPAKILPSETPVDKLKAYTIKDNVPFGENDWELLSNEWDTEQLTEWGLDIPDFAVQNLEAEEDDFTIPDEIVTDIVLGDLFEIGQHRLLCGSATDISTWEKLNIQANTACFTSPPYNAGTSAKLNGNKNASKKGNFYETHDDAQTDESYSELIQESLSNAISFCDGIAFNVQPLAGNKSALIDWLSNNKSSFVDIITWDKGQAQPAMAEGVLNSRFEWICIFNRENNSRHIPLASWRGTMNNVYSAPAQKSNEFSKVHAATFPVHLPSFIIADLMNRCAGVVDCFMGTGTTMVAAHQLGRKSYGIELDPKYCQVIVDRMRKLDPSIEIKRNGQPYKTGEKQV